MKKLPVTYNRPGEEKEEWPQDVTLDLGFGGGIKNVILFIFYPNEYRDVIEAVEDTLRQSNIEMEPALPDHFLEAQLLYVIERNAKAVSPKSEKQKPRTRFRDLLRFPFHRG